MYERPLRLIPVLTLATAMLAGLRGGAADPDGSPDAKVKAARELTAKAQEYEEWDSFESAAKLYEEALKLFPTNPAARLRLGVCYANLGKKGPALEHLRAVANAPKAPLVVLQEARLQVESLLVPPLSAEEEKRFDVASVCLDRAMLLKADAAGDPWANEEYQRVLRAAIDGFTALAKRRADYFVVQGKLGYAFEALGETDKAAVAFEEYLKMFGELKIPLSTDQKEVRKRIALLRLTPTANAAASKPALTPTHANKLLSAAAEAEAFGQYPEAVRLYLEVLKSYPGQLVVRLKLADCFRVSNEKEKAVTQYRYVAKHKGVVLAQLEEACDGVLELTNPILTADDEKAFAEATTTLKAGLALRSGYAVTDPSQHLDVRNRASALCKKAIAQLNPLAQKHPEHGGILLRLAEAYGAVTSFQTLPATNETRPQLPQGLSDRGTAAHYKQFLDWYAKLDLPDNKVVQEAKVAYAMYGEHRK